MDQLIQDKKTEIETDIKTNRIVLYMKGNKMAPQCGFSSQVVQIVGSFEIPFEVRDVLQDDILREAIKAYSDWPTIPQLYVDGEFIGGCDIVTELYQNGELQAILTPKT